MTTTAFASRRHCPVNHFLHDLRAQAAVLAWQIESQPLLQQQLLVDEARQYLGTFVRPWCALQLRGQLVEVGLQTRAIDHDSIDRSHGTGRQLRGVGGDARQRQCYRAHHRNQQPDIRPALRDIHCAMHQGAYSPGGTVLISVSVKTQPVWSPA